MNGFLIWNRDPKFVLEIFLNLKLRGKLDGDFSKSFLREDLVKKWLKPSRFGT